jgi:hypothetical protein
MRKVGHHFWLEGERNVARKEHTSHTRTITEYIFLKFHVTGEHEGKCIYAKLIY